MSEPRIIKRYTNRKLYDTRESRYVTLSQIAAMVRAGEEMTVIDNGTKEDLTSLTLAQIIYEQEKKSSEVLPLSALRELVRRSEARFADLKESPVGRFLSRGEGDEPLSARPPLGREEAEGAKSVQGHSRMNWEEWQRKVDERLRTLLENVVPFSQLQEEMRRISLRIEELEGRLRSLPRKGRDEGPARSSSEPPGVQGE
jgi:polyhydroxyalkanoate synthesis repressor PhaR